MGPDHTLEVRLEWRAGRALAAEVHMETLEHSAALVEQHAKTLSGIPEMADRLSELRASLKHVRQLFAAELERYS